MINTATLTPRNFIPAKTRSAPHTKSQRGWPTQCGCTGRRPCSAPQPGAVSGKNASHPAR